MYGYTGSTWSDRSCNKRCEETFGAVPGKQSTDSLQKNSYTRNVTYSTRNLRGGAGVIAAGSRDVPGENGCENRQQQHNDDNDDNNNNNINGDKVEPRCGSWYSDWTMKWTIQGSSHGSGKSVLGALRKIVKSDY